MSKYLTIALIGLLLLSVSALKHKKNIKLQHEEESWGFHRTIAGGWTYHNASQISQGQQGVLDWVIEKIPSLKELELKQFGTQVVAGTNYEFDFQNEELKEKANVKVYQALDGTREITAARKLKLVQNEDGQWADKKALITKETTMDAAIESFF